MGLFKRKTTKPEGDKVTNNYSKPPTLNGNGHLKTPNRTTTTTAAVMDSIPAIPDVPLPKAPDPTAHPAAYLRSIYAVRQRSKLVFEKAKKNQLKHFTIDMTKFPDTAAYVVSIIKVLRKRNRKEQARLTIRSGTLRQTSPQSLHTVDGSTSMSAEDHASISSWHPGLLQSIPKKRQDV